MKLIAFNGSPRKAWNTATLLNKALEGAATQGAQTELIHLYDLNYKGCISCFACKTIGSSGYGKCAVQDDLTPIFKAVEEADALLFGSPIYLGRIIVDPGIRTVCGFDLSYNQSHEEASQCGIQGPDYSGGIERGEDDLPDSI